MKLFECQHCGQPLYFENTRCESCGHSLGYMSDKETITALEPIDKAEGGDGTLWRALAEPKGRYRYCANARHEVCNWLVDADGPESYCAACRHNRTIPDLSQPQNLTNWRKIEVAKHRLIYSLLRLRLPLATKQEDPNGLAFDFVAAAGSGPLMTGHANGLITINLAEADDTERERRRNNLAEPYRTLLGHFRHEIAHYYWDRLIKDAPGIEEFRALFGDDRADYGKALQQHYANGPPQDWPDNYVTSYASSHAWEDFAETWAHYFHMVDTLEIANAFGMRVRPRVTMGADLATAVDFDAYATTMDRIIDAWLPLTFAFNSINRSMGLSDLYPFLLKPQVIVKLSFVHNRIRAAGVRRTAGQGRDALRAVAAGLKRPVGTTEST